MADHSGHAHHDHAAAAAGHAHSSPAAATVATLLQNATAAVVDAGADFVNSPEAKAVSDFLADLSASSEDAAGGAGHGGHGAHSAAGHEGHGEMAGHHMMKMWFHGGNEEVILFDWWRTDSCMSLLISCIIIFVMGALYEGVKWFRVYLQMSRERTRMNPAHAAGKTNGAGCGGDHVPLRDVTEEQNGFGPTCTPPAARRGITIAAGRDGPFSVFRLVEAVLYALQLVLAYWLMLIVMTYNTWLTVAVIAGAAFGHWLFAILNILSPSGDRADSFTTDACH